MSKPSEKDDEKMERYTFRLPPSLLDIARQKAGLIPLSKIIRVLIEKWLSGEIVIDSSQKN